MNKTCYTKSTYSGSSLLLCCVKREFNLQLHLESDFETVIDDSYYEIQKILDRMLKFTTGKTEVTGTKLIEEIFKSIKTCDIDKSHMSILKFLFENEKYHINMKDSIPLNGMGDIESLAEIQVVEFLWTLYDVFNNLTEDRELNNEDHYNNLKMCMHRFLGLTGEAITDKGVGSWLVTGLNHSTKKPNVFRSDPDVTLGIDGFLKCPVIPVEVYSLSKQAIQEDGKESEELCYKCSCDVTNEDSFQSYVSFLTQNIPAYILESSSLNCSENDFKSKLITQHILQILGTAAKYCCRKKYIGEKLNKNRVFIGLLACQQYVYVSKVIGDEVQFAKCKEQNISSTAEIVEFGRRPRVVPSIKALSKIHVYFSPTVYDLAIHNHRMALLIFLKYYMRNWEYLMDIRDDKTIEDQHLTNIL